MKTLHTLLVMPCFQLTDKPMIFNKVPVFCLKSICEGRLGRNLQGVTQWFLYIYIYWFIGIQPLGRFSQKTEPSQATGMALARCILGKFLGVVSHCFTLHLNVPTFAARCLHAIYMYTGWWKSLSASYDYSTKTRKNILNNFNLLPW
jgi:hypothetical protein